VRGNSRPTFPSATPAKSRQRRELRWSANLPRSSFLAFPRDSTWWLSIITVPRTTGPVSVRTSLSPRAFNCTANPALQVCNCCKHEITSLQFACLLPKTIGQTEVLCRLVLLVAEAEEISVFFNKQSIVAAPVDSGAGARRRSPSAETVSIGWPK
jgi:hypothetical protein